MRFGGLRIFLLLTHVDPVVHFANSGSEKLEATLEIGKLYGIAPPEFSYIPLSQCKLQEVCCGERLRVIVFDKIAILSSERALNCSKTLYFDEVSKYFCMVRSLACPSRIEFLPCFDRRPPGSLQWKTHGLPVPFETSSSWDHSTSDYWMYFTYTSDVIDVLWQQYIVLQCRINDITSSMSLNYFKIQEVLGRVRVQAILKPFLWSSPLCQTSYPIVNCPLRSTIKLCLEFSIISLNSTAPSSSRGIDGSCRSNLIMAFDTVKNLDGISLDWCPSSFFHKQE